MQDTIIKTKKRYAPDRWLVQNMTLQAHEGENSLEADDAVDTAESGERKKAFSCIVHWPGVTAYTYGYT